jgi:hypothetical protein
MPTALTLQRCDEEDTLVFSGNIQMADLVRAAWHPVTRVMIEAAERADSSMGDKLRALAALMDEIEGRVK